MVFRRESRLTSKLRRGLLRAVCVAVVLFIGPAVRAEAAVQLQKVQVSEGARVDLLFDSALDPARMTTEYFNDIIQISFTEANVYPAKILSVAGKDLTKVFAYQYAPGLVRCRFTVKGRAEDYKDRISVNASGKILSVKFNGGGIRLGSAGSLRDSIQISAARPLSSGRGGEGVDESTGMTSDEKQLLQRVLQGGKSSAAAVKSLETGKAAQSRSRSKVQSGSVSPGKGNEVSASADDSGSTRLGGAPDLPSPIRPFGYLLLVCALIVSAGLGFRKFFTGGSDAGSRLFGHRGLGSFLSRIGVSVPPRDRRNQIEVLASHPLGQKKSLAIVRVGGVRMVLGISDESISLISRLASDDDAEDAAMASDEGIQANLRQGRAHVAEDFGNASFEDSIAESLLEGSSGRTQDQREFGPPGAQAGAATAAGRPVFANVLGQEARRQGARDQIRSRLGTLKPL